MAAFQRCHYATRTAAFGSFRLKAVLCRTSGSCHKPYPVLACTPIPKVEALCIRSHSLAFFGSELDLAHFTCREAHSPQFLDPRFLPCRSLRIRFDQGETMSDTVGSAGDRIRSFVERTEQLDNAIPELTESRKEVFAEAKSEVFDLKILRRSLSFKSRTRTSTRPLSTSNCGR